MVDNEPLLGLSLRRPPSNVVAEQALLGALLANNKARDKCISLLPEHFFDPELGRAFRRITERIDDGKATSVLSLKDEFSDALIAELLGSMISIIGVPEYAEVILECAHRRILIEVGEKLISEGFVPNGDLPVSQVAMDAVSRLGDASDYHARQTPDFATAAANVVRQADEANRAVKGGLTVGIESVDQLWCGLWPGRFYYLMARSRTGKTPAMMQFVRHMAKAFSAVGHGEHIHVFSLEMSVDDLQRVNFAGETRWSADQIQAGHIGDAAAWKEFDDARERIGMLPIIVDDGRFDFPTLATRARRIAKLRHTRLICVDYMDLVRRDEKHARMGLPEWIPTIGYEFKDLAKELDVPVLVLRQVNKARDKAESTRPMLTDLPYDGGQAADDVFYLYRRELDMPADPPGFATLRDEDKRSQAKWAWDQERARAAGQAEFGAVKRRFGALGRVPLLFDGPRMLLRPIDMDNPQNFEWSDIS